MKYEELVERVRVATKNRFASREVGTIAFQFNVTGESEGAFYVEVSNGKINVEPYEYYDREVLITTSEEVLLQMLEGKIRPMEAYINEQIEAEGNIRSLKYLPFGVEGKAVVK